jgi:hypothetical protein
MVQISDESDITNDFTKTSNYIGGINDHPLILSVMDLFYFTKYNVILVIIVIHKIL